jgi:beta-lactamase regulating signal transducer with metallopeptidase domain
MVWWLAQNLVIVGLLTGVVALLCRLASFRPAVRHALWLVVMVKLLSPPLFDWPWPVPDSGPLADPWSRSPAAPEEQTAQQPETPDNHPAATFLPEIADFGDPVPAKPATPLSDDLVKSVGSYPVIGLASLALALWLAGSVVMVLFQVIRLFRFRRLLAQGRPGPRWLRRQVKALAARLGLRPPATLVVSGVGSPALWGFGWPRLLWPAALLKRLSPASRCGILVHELAHLRRRDHWTGGLILLGECLWWWNPLFWYVRRQLRLQAELACDAWVVALMPEDRRAYAEALLEVTQFVSQTAAPAPALGMTGGARQALERRLTMIMQEQVPCRLSLLGLAAAGLLALLALPGWSQDPANKTEQPKKSESTQPAPTVLQGVLDAQADDEMLVGALILDPERPPATDADRDRRLQKLEEQLEALLKEVKALRAGPPKNLGLAATLQDVNAAHKTAVSRLRVLAAQPQQVHTLLRARVITLDEQEVSLSRATYKLPQATADALAKFLREHVKAQVMETKIEGDSLTVTTTPDAQKAIKGLIGLIQGKPVAAAEPQPSNTQPLNARWQIVPDQPANARPH